jgi:general stress protein CsbA
MINMNTYYIIALLMIIIGALSFITDSNSSLFLIYLPLSATFFFLGADEAKKKKKEGG